MIPAHIAAWALNKRKSNEEHRVGESIEYDEPKKKDDHDRPITIKAKGGGHVAAPDPMAEAKASAYLAQEQARIKAEQDQQAAAKAAAERADLLSRASTKRNAAYGSARNYGSTQANSGGYDQGLMDKYGVLNAYYGDLEGQLSGIDETNLNPAFTTNTSWNNALTAGQNRYRGDTERAINSVAGTGFETNMIADTADDNILRSILGGQKSSAEEQIMAAYKRGQLSDIGYQKAEDQMATADKAGMADLQKIGGGVLTGYRNSLDTLKSNALQTAGGLTLADKYDVNDFNKSLQSSVTGSMGNLEGDVYGAVGSQQFFDPTKMISLAGAQQGFYNPSAQAPGQSTEGNPLLNQFTEQQKRNAPAASTVF